MAFNNFDEAEANYTSISNSFAVVNISGGTNYLGSQLSNSYELQHEEPREWRARVKSSLAFEGQHYRYDQVADAFPGTYGWVFTQAPQQWASFTKWLEIDDTIYWIHGKPGSGKSTLMRFIARHERLGSHLKSWSGGSDVAVFTYFFWRAGNLLQRSTAGLLRSLLHQAFERHPRLADKLVTRPMLRWSEGDLFACVRDVFRQYPHHALLVIDGIDEFEGEQNAVEKLLDLITELSRLPKVKVCTSSRPESAIVASLSGCKSLRLQDLTAKDLHEYARGRFERIDYFQYLKNTQFWPISEFVHKVVQQADGVFLWLYLAVETLARGLKNRDTLPILEKRLSLLGSSLHDIFIFLVSRIEPFYLERVAQAVGLLLSRKETRRPLPLFAIIQRLDPELPDLAMRHASPSDMVDTFVQCQMSIRRLVLQSGGLFEVVPIRHVDFTDWHCEGESWMDCKCLPVNIPATNEHSRLHSRKLVTHFRSQQLCFIHRSAFEFFASEHEALKPMAQYIPENNVNLSLSNAETALRFEYTLEGYLASINELGDTWKEINILGRKLQRSSVTDLIRVLMDWEVELDFMGRDLGELIDFENQQRLTSNSAHGRLQTVPLLVKKAIRPVLAQLRQASDVLNELAKFLSQRIWTKYTSQAYSGRECNATAMILMSLYNYTANDNCNDLVAALHVLLHRRWGYEQDLCDAFKIVVMDQMMARPPRFSLYDSCRRIDSIARAATGLSSGIQWSMGASLPQMLTTRLGGFQDDLARDFLSSLLAFGPERSNQSVHDPSGDECFWTHASTESDSLLLGSGVLTIAMHLWPRSMETNALVPMSAVASEPSQSRPYPSGGRQIDFSAYISLAHQSGAYIFRTEKIADVQNWLADLLQDVPSQARNDFCTLIIRRSFQRVSDVKVHDIWSFGLQKVLFRELERRLAAGVPGNAELGPAQRLDMLTR